MIPKLRQNRHRRRSSRCQARRADGQESCWRRGTIPGSCRNSTRTRPSAGTSGDRKSTRLNSSHLGISYAVFCLKKKKKALKKNNDKKKKKNIKNINTISVTHSQ